MYLTKDVVCPLNPDITPGGSICSKCKHYSEDFDLNPVCDKDLEEVEGYVHYKVFDTEIRVRVASSGLGFSKDVTVNMDEVLRYILHQHIEEGLIDHRNKTGMDLDLSKYNFEY